MEENKNTLPKIENLWNCNDYVFKLVLQVAKHFEKLARPVLIIASRDQKQTVSPVTNDLLKISATDLAIKIRNRELSSEKICQAYITRIKEVNPLINAVVEDRFEAAIVEAKSVDNYLSNCSLSKSELERTKPLLGVPFTVKNSCMLKGMEYSIGQIKRSGIKAKEDGTVVAFMKASGAIPLLVSTTTELCFATNSRNKLNGTTNNPYDTSNTAGGSSSGEGALLGAGASIIGIGSDIGGSIRIPAAFNGLFGHKASSGVSSLYGHYPYDIDGVLIKYGTIGPIVRYAKDLKLIMNVIAYPEAKPRLKLNEKVDLSKIEMFYMDNIDSNLPDTDVEIKEAISRAANYFKNKFGSTIVKKNIPELDDPIRICGQPLVASKSMTFFTKHCRLPVEEFFKSIFEQSEFSTEFCVSVINQNITSSLLLNQSSQLAKHEANISNFLGDNKILILPTTRSSAGKHLESLLDIINIEYTIFANAFGLPATSIPCGLNKNGMPIGIQITAGPLQDRLCLAVAEELEKCFGGWIPPQS